MARPRGGSASSRPAPPLPAPVIFGHFLLAAGLVVWIIYVAVDKTPPAWAALIIPLPVAALGFTMSARWIGVYHSAVGSDGSTAPGLLAATLVLVLLTAIGMSGS